MKTRIAIAWALLAALMIWSPWGSIGGEDTHAVDIGLVLRSLAHAVLGCAVALLPWVASAGLVSLGAGKRGMTLHSTMISSYPLSIVFSLIWVLLSFLLPFGTPVAFMLMLVCSAPLLQRFANDPASKPLILTVIQLCIVAVVFGAWIGFVKHGPSITLEARPHGDFNFYASSIHAIASAATFPIPDLTIEGETYLGFNLLFPAIGATLLKLFEIDGFLFLGAGGGAYFLLTSFLCLYLYLRETKPFSNEGRLNSLQWLALGLAVMSVSLYPTWIVDSIPMIYGLAVTISVWYLTKKTASTGSALTGPVAAIIAPALSKVVLSAVLFPLALFSSYKYIKAMSNGWRIFSFILMGCGAIYFAAMIVEFGPRVYAVYKPIPLSIVYYHCCHAVLFDAITRDVATLGFIIISIFALRSMQGMIIASALLLGMLFPVLFSAATSFAGIVLALIVLEDQRKFEQWKWPLILFAALATVRSSFGDPSAVANVIWVGGFICALYILRNALSFVETAPTAQSRVHLFATAVFLMMGTTGFIALANGSVKVGSGQWVPSSNYPALNPDTYDVWKEVSASTQRDSLIFVDSVSKNNSLTEGWNTYAAHGERQIYISQWVQSRDPRPDEGFIKPRLLLNESVIRGEIKPSDVPTKRAYNFYYMVLKSEKPPPKGWELLYKNASYSIFKWVDA